MKIVIIRTNITKELLNHDAKMKENMSSNKKHGSFFTDLIGYFLH